ncbi:hypothetical protein TWF191_006693 [Orbilia oligospora]|uniref:Uncharacterized protein n=1 Tax=Orbilia oligospora TaxID=2813651 RepID=A0A7C8QQ09_ORBOL|nr:hypothetical protein TWF191_006693 [Orbilia oligospora]
MGSFRSLCQNAMGMAIGGRKCIPRAENVIETVITLFRVQMRLKQGDRKQYGVHRPCKAIRFCHHEIQFCGFHLDLISLVDCTIWELFRDAKSFGVLAWALGSEK